MAFAVGAYPLGLGIALVALGLALAPPWRLPATCFALGMIWPAAHGEIPGPGAPTIDPERPATVIGVVAGHWRRSSFGWTAPLAIEAIEQGSTVFPLPRETLVSLAGERPPPGLGSHVQIEGYLHRGSEYWNRAPRPPLPWRLTVKSPRLVTLVAGPGWVGRLSAALRQRVEGAFDQVGGSPGLALARAFVLGDASRIDSQVLRGLRRLGLSHLLSVSGVHVSVVGGLVLFLAGRAPRALRFGLALLAVVLYSLLVGPLPAVLRAATMAALGLAAFSFRRPPSPENALALAAGGLVAMDPSLVLDLGFQLTMAATAGLVFLARPLAERWQTLPWGLGRAFAATVAAELATLPFVLPAFHLLVPIAPVANLLALPWATLMLAVDGIWTFVALLSPAGAAAMTPVLDVVAAPFLGAARWRGSIGLTMPLSLPPLVAWGLAAASYGLLWRGRLWHLGLAATALLAFILVPPHHPTELVVLDVGQGDGILIKDGRHAMLVDGGGWQSGDFASAVLLPALLAEGVSRLDAVLLTHGDLDHCGGLRQIADVLPVAEVWTSHEMPETGCGADLAHLRGPRQRRLAAGDRLRLGTWRLSVLHPDATSGRSDNDGSLVVIAEARGRRFLLTGDLEAGGEAEVVERHGSWLASDVLKVAHHGSRTSSSPAFLAASQPKWAFVSVGRRNRYHHPAPEVVQRLQQRGVRILRTDQVGCIRARISPRGSLLLGVCGPG